MPTVISIAPILPKHAMNYVRNLPNSAQRIFEPERLNLEAECLTFCPRMLLSSSKTIMHIKRLHGAIILVLLTLTEAETPPHLSLGSTFH